MQTTYQTAEGMQQYARQGDTDCAATMTADTPSTKAFAEHDLPDELRPLYRAIHGMDPLPNHMRWLK
jgi:hypothetical protein